MRAKRFLGISMVIALLIPCVSLQAWADRDSDRRDKPYYKDDNRYNDSRYYRTDSRVYDRRYDHNRYYPAPGVFINTLPPTFHVAPYQGISYYFSAGVWYRPSGARFVVVMPPVGITVPVLPRFYTTIWVGGIPYYYADGVYYHWVPEQRVYVVAPPPQESQVTTTPAEADQLFVYPKEGQSAEQQAADRYQCHSWAKEQTGFDPTRPSGNVESGEYNSKRTDYQRAMKACLEARGYSVQ